MSTGDLRIRHLQFAVVLVAVIVSAASSSSAPPPGGRDDDLLKGVPPAAKRGDSGREGPPGASRRATPAGEDLGQASNRNDWLAVERLMAQAAARLSEGETATTTQQLQQSILKRLTQLVSASTATQRSRSQSSDSQQRKRPGQGEPDRDRKPAKTAAKQGSPAKQRKIQAILTPQETADAASKVWGKLPPTVQEQLRSAGRIDFLPGYERQIEAYYRQLAKRSGEDRK